VADLALALLLIAGLLFAHAEALASMVNVWSSSTMYSYGFLVPLISLYLVWHKREKLAALRPRPARLLALPVLLFGAALLLAGRFGDVQTLQQLAFPVSLVGALLLILGRDYVRTAWAALAYLLLMVPIWEPLTEPLHWPFQNHSATLAVHVLRGVGIPAYHDGTLIALPNIVLEVARSCSGVNYLIAVLALGIPLSYVHLCGWWRRVLLVGSAVAIAAVSNGLRVALIGVLAYFEIGSPLHGPFHTLHGLFVSSVGFLALYAGLRVLAPSSRPSRVAAPGGRPIDLSGLKLRIPETATLALVFFGLGVLSLTHTPSAVPLTTHLEALPVQLGRWVGQPSPDREDPRWWHGANEQLFRRYCTSDGRCLDVYVGYFEVQRNNGALANYRSSPLHRVASSVLIGTEGLQLQANLAFHPHQGGGHLLFWYEIDGIVETSQHLARLRTAWNAVARARTNGAVVMIAATDSRDPAEELHELALLVHQALGRLLPGRQLEVLPVSASSGLGEQEGTQVR
jgi:EpsI family protein